MYHNYKLESCDPLRPYQPGNCGVFEIPVTVGQKKRRMLAYAPVDIRESTAGILVLGENGKTADDLLQHSGWCTLADQEECQEKFIVFFLEPENGVWAVDEAYGTADGDVAYINAAALRAAERWLFCVHESKIYLTGCREGGVLANMAAAWNPAFYAGIATAGGSAVSAAYLSDAGKAFCTELDGYTDESHRKNIRKGEIPLPAWIIDDPKSVYGTGNAPLAYWQTACGTNPRPRQLSPDCVEYTRTDDAPYAPNQEKAAYRVCHSILPGASAAYAGRMQRRIWKDFLYRQRRWMSSPGGDLRVTQDPVRDLGMEYHYEQFDDWMREWYVYLPESVKQTPSQKVPLVFAMHGYTCTGEIYAGNSDWHKVAEKHGFIVVFPSALHGRVSMPAQGLLPDWAPLPAWNVFQEDDRPDELRFFNHMLDELLTQYPVDPARVFATGHSWGSLMTQMLCFGMSDRLAAAAPCSGVFFGDSLQRMMDLPFAQNAQPELPVWMFWGMEEAWLIPPLPAHDNVTGQTLELWLMRNHKPEMIPQSWPDCAKTVNGRFIDHRLEKDGTAPVWFTQVEYMPHATMPEMSFRIWEEFFSQFSCQAKAQSEADT